MKSRIGRIVSYAGIDYLIIRWDVETDSYVLRTKWILTKQQEHLREITLPRSKFR